MQLDRILDAPPAPTNHRHRNLELDWLRAYAVSLVIGLHLGRILVPGRTMFDQIVPSFVAAGGVDLFFVISGFVIAGSLEPLWAGTTRNGSAAFVRTFLVRRFWRLWPASTLWISYCLLASWICGGLGGWPPASRVAWQWFTALIPVFELQEFRHPGVLGYYWTLSVEWQFYALFPLLLIAVRSPRGRSTLLALLFLVGLYTNELSPMLRFASIVGGIGVYRLHRSGRVSAAPADPGLLAPRSAFVVTAASLAVLVTVPQLPNSMLLGQLALTVLCAILVALAAAERRLISDCFMPRLLTWIGLRSYSLYLCHIPVALTLWAFLDRFDRAQAANRWMDATLVGLALAISLLLADLSYRHVELPLQRRRR